MIQTHITDTTMDTLPRILTHYMTTHTQQRDETQIQNGSNIYYAMICKFSYVKYFLHSYDSNQEQHFTMRSKEFNS